jgi:hypothetical protein
MKIPNNSNASSRAPRELHGFIKGVLIYVMATSGFSSVAKLTANLASDNAILGFIMFACEVANICFAYAILKKKGWGVVAFFGMLLSQIPFNLFLESPDMPYVYASTFIRIALFSLILLIPKNGVTGWSVLFGKEKILSLDTPDPMPKEES